MRRLCALILCVLLLATTVCAESAVSSASVTGSVTPNGACQIVLNVSIRLESPSAELTFPIGSDVSSVSVNGRKATLSKDGNITSIVLKDLKNQTGTFQLAIHYTVNKVVFTDPETEKQIITVPLLYGFKYPVEQMQFSVTMPGIFDGEPEFHSGYHEQDIERNLTYQVNGATVSGQINAKLKDYETLFLILTAPEGMFAKEQAPGGSLALDSWAMGILAVLATLYWLITMSRMPIIPVYRATAPDGISAGVVGSYLAHATADLSLMVVNWAQLGYLMIQLDGNGRVLLHKKMNMGNERNAFEQRCFKNLFAGKSIVDATSYRYARLWDATAKTSKRYAAGYRKGSGNILLLRLLAAGVALFAGIAVGDCITSSPVWRVFWMFLLAVLFAAAGWMIHRNVQFLRLQDRVQSLWSLLLAAAMLAVGLLVPAGFVYAAVAAGFCLLSGLSCVYGGKRTENGTLIYGDLLGLRRYMRKVSRAELERILHSNPNYYFELAPFALAMGVDRKLAKQFDNLHIPACPWLIAGMAAPRTAGEWYPLLREAVDSMNALAKRPFWEKYGAR